MKFTMKCVKNGLHTGETSLGDKVKFWTQYVRFESLDGAPLQIGSAHFTKVESWGFTEGKTYEFDVKEDER